MKVWIHIDGSQEGPYEITELPLERMTAETPVWYEGLADWQPAGEASATAYLFGPYSEASSEAKPADSYDPWSAATARQPAWGKPAQQSASQQMAQQPVAAAQEAPAKCPPTRLALSIAMAVLFLNPIALVSVVLGFLIRSRFVSGNLQGAQSLSETNDWWVMVSIVTCLIALPLMLIARV